MSGRGHTPAELEAALRTAETEGCGFDFADILAAEVRALRDEVTTLAGFREAARQLTQDNSALRAELGNCEEEFRKPLRDEIAQLKATVAGVETLPAKLRKLINSKQSWPASASLEAAARMVERTLKGEPLGALDPRLTYR